MHLRFRVIRNLLASVALVAFALPLTGSLTASVPSAHAQSSLPTSSIGTAPAPKCDEVGTNGETDCYVSASGAGQIDPITGAPGFNPATNATTLFNLVGTPETVNFTCESGTQNLGGGTGTGGNADSGVVPGCYDVVATVTNESTGSASAFTAGNCGQNPTTVSGASINCASYQSPLCPAGFVTTPSSGSLCTTVDTAAPEGSQLHATINPGSQGVFLFNFTGYTPLLGTPANPLTGAPATGCDAIEGTDVEQTNGTDEGSIDVPESFTPPLSNPDGDAVHCENGAPACPDGMSYVAPGPGLNLTTAIGLPPFEAPVPAPDGACMFTITAEKKYLTLTSLNLTTNCAVQPATLQLTFSEGLKAFFGPDCSFTVTADATVLISENSPACPGLNGSAAPNPPFPAGSTYQCIGSTLYVHIAVIHNGFLGGPQAEVGQEPNDTDGAGDLSGFENIGIPLNINVSGQGAAYNVGDTPTPTLGGLCFGTAGGPETTSTTTLGSINPDGSIAESFEVCPTGPGEANVSVCYGGNGLDNPGGPICSNTVPLTYTFPANVRVVPYVRWAGEKQVLTKCFGGAGQLANLPVEFSIGADSNTGQLIPVDANSTLTFPTSTTVWSVTDANGCASVIVYAANEGVVNVDASIFSGAGSEALINEHAFQVFYLRFEDLTLENPTFGGSPFFTAGVEPSVPGAAGAGPYNVPNICAPDLIRAMVRGYFEFPGNPSGRGTQTNQIPGAGALGNTNTSYVLPAGRWVLPDDWPLLATFAGFNSSGAPFDNIFGPGTPATASSLAWDLNSGNALDQSASDPAINCATPLGPCFGTATGTDGNPTFYGTADGQILGCDDGLTVGIGPFDITQACTYNISGAPLAYTPRGATTLTGGPTNFGVGFISSNSTYLPNGVLNKWDTPMPPAQISFGITAGLGFLAPASKAAIYQNGTFTTATCTVSGVIVQYGNSAASCTAAGGTYVAAIGVPNYNNPFYGEIIPASPLIPPVTNNGGYLWDSYGFTSQQTFFQTASGAFVAGEQDPAGNSSVTNPLSGACDESGGYTLGTNGSGHQVCFIGTGGSDNTGVTASECADLGGTFNKVSQPAYGTCFFPIGAPSVAPGTNLSTFGSPATTYCPTSVAGGSQALDTNEPDGDGSAPVLEVAVPDASGYTVGQGIDAYSTTTGNYIFTGGTVAAVEFGEAFNGGTADVLEINLPANVGNVCVAPGQAVFVSEQLGFTLPAGVSAPGIGDTVVFNSNTTASATVNSISGSTVYVNGAEALAVALGGCELSRRAALGGSLSFGACEPSGTGGFLPNATAAGFGPSRWPVHDACSFNSNVSHPDGDCTASTGMGVYNFWNWVPNSSPQPNLVGPPRNNQVATAYSDNHGETDVMLTTGVGTACTAGSLPSLVSCGFSSLNAPAACTAAQINQNTGQPNAGVICTNALGGIELGTGAALGSSTVQAVADYPYVRGINQPIGQVGGGVVKNFTSAFLKSVTVTPSGGVPGPAGTTTYVVTIKAVDICGNPIVGESVSVFALTQASGAVVLAPVGTGGTNNGTSAATVITGANGTATLSLEVLGLALGNAGLTIKAVFTSELLERFAIVVPGVTPAQTITVSYNAGYATLSLPAPTVITTAEKIFQYTPATTPPWTDVTQPASTAPGLSSAAPACTGYMAYFAQPTTLVLNLPTPIPAAGTTAVCNLTGTWTLLGNPFATPALLPSGTVAYAWDGSTYTPTSQIAVGRAVFVYNAGAATTITLTAS